MLFLNVIVISCWIDSCCVPIFPITTKIFGCICVSAPCPPTLAGSPTISECVPLCWVCGCMCVFLQQPPTLPPGHKASGKSCFLGYSIRVRRISCGPWRNQITLRSQTTVLLPLLPIGPPPFIQTHTRNLAEFSIKVLNRVQGLGTEQSCT